MSEQTLDKLRACGVKTLQIPERFSGGCVNDYRWELYRDYLCEHVDDYSMIFTSDVRDVIFQQDVFKFYDGTTPFLAAGYEDGNLSSDTNKKWLIDRYGLETWQSMKDYRIICSGTIWGTAQEFIDFASVMADNINSGQFPYSRVCDQAVANWMIYHEKMFSDIFTASGNPDGKVITIGLTRPADIRVDSDGTIRNTNEEIAAVVHMYDRHRKTARAVFSKYGREIPFAKKFKVIHSNDKIVRVMNLIRRKGIFRSASLLVRRKIAKLLGKELPLK